MDPKLFVQLMLLAFVATEGAVEYVFGTLFDKVAKLTPHKWTLMYVSMLAGLGLTFYYHLDLVSMVGLPVSPVGIAITGILVGRGANFISDVFGLIASWTKK